MKKYFKWVSITLVTVLVSLLALLFFSKAPPLLGEVAFSQAVFDSHHHLLRMTLTADGQYRLYTPLSVLPKELIQATLLEEDRFFYWHPGINPVALLTAVFQTYLQKNRRVGGSTLTMQVARLRFNLYSKTILGKCVQMIRALQLSFYYSKTEILEAYFNLAPYGHNIQGVGAASYIYFGKQARALTLPESLTLAVIPQHPRLRARQITLLQYMRQKLFKRWLREHPADILVQPLMDLPIQFARREDLPFFAPHFVNEILKQTSFATRQATEQQQITTTLDLSLQQQLYRIMRQYLARYASLGVNNAGIMVVDARDMRVKALIGSADFFNQSIAGQIDGTTMRRSPGSTLKPFIYALAIDQGLIHPKTMLKDVPRHFGGYHPENFDHDFKGPISATEALRLSRNIPAIDLAAALKHPSLYELLSRIHVKHLKSQQYYGLSLVLGGALMSMQELVMLYAALVNDGVYHSLRFTEEKPLDKGVRLFSPEASFLVLEMLNEKGVSYKTGTSSGYRDAWTIGVAGPYVLAVWIGHFNQQGNAAFIGRERAAPLFFALLPALHVSAQALSNLPKKTVRLNLRHIAVCKISGMLPTKYCPETEKVWFIPGKSPITTDTIHREIAINAKTGLRTCEINKYTRFITAEFWPADLLVLFKQAHMSRPIPPPYDASCGLMTKTFRGFAPQIISPKLHVNYVARLRGEKTFIPFMALPDADVRELHWFLNTTYLGKTRRDQPFIWQAMPGKYVLRVVDDAGRADARHLQVEVQQ